MYRLGVIREFARQYIFGCGEIERRLGAALAVVVGLVGSAQAYDLPNLNLGFTSFLDGAPPSGPGWYVTQYVQYYTANRLTDNNGHSLGFPREDVRALVGISQLAYVSTVRLGPGVLGLDLLIAYVPYASIDDGLGGAVLRAKSGVGDSFIGPFIQFDPIMGKNGPLFVGRFEATLILPTGQYNPDAAVNPGSNFFSFNPYIAGTLFLTQDWTVSVRLHYLWNATNDRPNVSLGPNVYTTQAGQAVHANFASEVSVTKALKVGINGYWLQQITDTLANGEVVPGRRERVYALGPGALLTINTENYLFFNAYYEIGARNRPEGQRFTTRWVGHF